MSQLNKKFIRKNRNSNLLKDVQNTHNTAKNKVEVRKRQPAEIYLTFCTSCVWKSSGFYVLYKLWTCSYNFIFKYLLATSHTLHFTLFASNLLGISYEFLFLNLFFRTLFYKKKRKQKKKIWEIVILTDRCLIKKTISKKKI